MCQTTRLAVPPLCALSFSFLYHASSFDSVNLWNDHPPIFVLWAEKSHLSWDHLCLARVWEPCRLVSSLDQVWSDAWVAMEASLSFTDLDFTSIPTPEIELSFSSLMSICCSLQTATLENPFVKIGDENCHHRDTGYFVVRKMPAVLRQQQFFENIKGLTWWWKQ